MWVSEEKSSSANVSFYGNDKDFPDEKSHSEWMTVDSPVNIVLHILLTISSELVLLECLKTSFSL